MEAYCVKCNQRRELVGVQPTTTKTGRPAVVGNCSVCGTKVFRMGRYDPEGASGPTAQPAAPVANPAHTQVLTAHDLDARTVLPIVAGLCLIVALLLINWLRKS